MPERALRLSAALLSLVVACAAHAAQPTDAGTACTPLNTSEGVHDYRTHKNSHETEWIIADGRRNHLDPALQRMRAGEFSQRTLADLDFILKRWPNHGPALEALIQYDLGGGKPYIYETTECYFQHALDFAPDDRAVLLAKAYWRFKKGDKQSAIGLYEDVLKLDPSSADAHYNLGLLYFDLSEYAKARDHAQAAYAAGYPLPGLRKKLQRVGQWSEPPTAQAK